MTKSYENHTFFKTMIKDCIKLDQSCNIFISNLNIIVVVTTESWKCFRCNLSFKDENVAELHKEISEHSVTKVKSIVA